MTLRHIRFIGHEGSVCDRPELLDRAFVRIDMTTITLGACKICLQLLVANREEEAASAIKLRFEGATNSGVLYLPAERDEEDMMLFWRGVAYATVGSSAFWVLFFLAVWAVFFRG